jgi:hypothetical protein
MNISRKCRSGNRRLNRRLGRRVGHYVIARLDGRPFRPPDWLAVACKALDGYVRLRKQAARRDPHLFGPHASRYFRDTVQLEQEQRETEAALRKVYGPSAPGQEWRPNKIWYERYARDPANKKFFRKWFKEHYGD